MLEQMGLKASTVPADMRDTIYTKLGLKTPAGSAAPEEPPKKVKPAKLSAAKRDKAKSDAQKQSVLAAQNEGDLLGALGGSEKLSMADVFQSLDSGQQEQTGGLNANKVRNQIKTLNKQQQGNSTLDAPIAGRKRVRQE